MEYIKEISPEQAVILWQESRLSLSRCYEKAPEILKVHGSVIGTLGNFSASIGKAKSKKTFNVSAIVAAALKNGTVLRYAAELPEEKRKVLYIDTEQSPYHCLKVMKRILRMAGLPDDRDSGYLEFLALRKYTPEQRISIVEQAIYHSPDIGLVIIDGIRDMVYDINSPGESTRIISKLMQWTDDRQIHIHTILHQNKGDENARGHIGTELKTRRKQSCWWKRTRETATSAMFPPCTSGRWISSLLHSASTTEPCPNLRKVTSRKQGSREDPRWKSLTLTRIFQNRSTVPHWKPLLH